MRKARRHLWLAVSVTLALALIGCSSGGGGGGGAATDQDATTDVDDNAGGDGATDDAQANDNQSDGTTDGTDDPGDGETDRLTDEEEDAVVDATVAAASIVVAAGTTQSGTDVLPAASASQADGQGDCPEVDFELEDISTLGFTVSIDFGDGCSPEWAPEATCSGSATGSFSQSDKTANLTFESLSCEGLVIDGEVNVTYDVTGAEVTLEGEGDLTAVGSNSVRTVGEGTAGYNMTSYVVTIPGFDGTVTADDDTWNMTVEDLAISYEDYGSFIPYQGVITVSGSDIRTISVRFNEDSPTMGEVEVSINGSRYVTIKLDVLLEALEAVAGA